MLGEVGGVGSGVVGGLYVGGGMVDNDLPRPLRKVGLKGAA